MKKTKSKAPAFRLVRLAVEITLLTLVVVLSLLVHQQEQTILHKDREIGRLVRDKLNLITDYKALQEQAKIGASGGY